MRYWMVFLGIYWATMVFGQDYQDEIIDHGQDEVYGVGQEYARMTFAERYVRVLRAGETEDALRNYPVVSGDIVESNHGAYSEIQFIDGTLMQIDGGSQVEFQAINEVYGAESLSVINLFEGGLFFHMSEPLFDLDSRVFRIDTRSGSVYLEASGIYRVDYQGSRLRLKVYRGIAEISGVDDSVLVRSGQYASISNGRYPGYVRPFNSFNSDKFERWAYGRSLHHDGASSRYVSGEIAHYARDLDDSGEWRYEPDIDIHVWVPRVSVDWRPYYNGYWTTCGSRLTWVPYDPFGWVTHHYGSWGWHTSWGWYWIPGRLFSPAWVAWTSYDNYLGWCPLGYWRTPYYYNRHFRPIHHVVHHHHHHWHYVETRHIRHRYPTRAIRTSLPHARRRVTTRPIYVSRDDFNQPRAITRVVREPEVNRSRATAKRQRSSELRSGVARQSQETTRVRIDSRSSGTNAVSRLSTPQRRSHAEPKRQRVSYEGKRALRDVPIASRSSNSRGGERTATRSSSSTSRRQAPERATTRQTESSSRVVPSTPERGTRSSVETNRSEATRQKPTKVEPRSTSRTPSRSSSATERTRSSSPPRSTAPPKRVTPSTPKSSDPPARKITPKKSNPKKRSGGDGAAAPRRHATPWVSRPSSKPTTSRSSHSARSTSSSRSSHAESKTYRSAPKRSSARRTTSGKSYTRSSPTPRSTRPSREAVKSRKSTPKPSYKSPSRSSKPSARHSSTRRPPSPRAKAPSRRSAPRAKAPSSRARSSSPKRSTSKATPKRSAPSRAKRKR